MPTPHPGIVVRIGPRPNETTAVSPAIDEPRPYLEWDLPADLVQTAFNLRISNLEAAPLGWAYYQSGQTASAEPHHYFPSGVEMNDHFVGLCQVELIVTAADGQEYAAPPLYFVFDRNRERLYKAQQVKLTWAAAQDPDQQPVGSRTYHIQIASDPRFQNVVFEQGSVPGGAGATVAFVVPRESFDPEERPDHQPVNYFWRVRASDGMDYGEWSPVNAFTNLTNTAPTIAIDSLVPLNNATGDVLVNFTLADAEGQPCSVELAYSTDTTGVRKPVRCVNTLIHVPPGSHQAIWRTRRTEGRVLLSQVVLYATAFDGIQHGPEAIYGPFVLDNRNLEATAGGIGSTRWSFPVRGHLAVRSQRSQKWQQPVRGRVAPPTHPLRFWQPVAHRGYAFARAVVIGTAERRSAGSDGNARVETPGWGTPNRLEWPCPLAKIGRENGEIFNGRHLSSSEVERMSPHTSEERFLFASPVDYEHDPRAWPRPFSTRELDGRPYLKGYYDAFGQAHDYPDGYDWAHQPASHRNREIWGTGDGWVQVQIFRYTEFRPCTLCQGRHWVPVPQGSVYARGPCPNPNCRDGFDITQPFLESLTLAEQQVGKAPRWEMHAYADIQWHRFSRWMAADSLSTRCRYGLVTVAPPVALGTAHQIQRPVQGFAEPGRTRHAFSLPQLPLLGKTDVSVNFAPQDYPVQGALGPPKTVFRWGMDPELHPGYATRPRPTQIGSGRIRGTIGRVYGVRPLGFRFLQSYWDAYNTLHWQMTGSNTSKVHLQWCRVFTDGSRSIWQDVEAQNATLDPETGAWLMDPLVFHAYWSTSDRDVFADGGNYQLRIRQYDALSRTFTGWVTSSPFGIISGASNPVSVLSTTYEPWSRSVQVQLRIDSTVGDRYTLTRFWYTADDGLTWRPIQKSHIGGETEALSSNRIGDQNLHEITWLAASYGLEAGNDYRLRIEAMPSQVQEQLVLPFFKWTSLNNPDRDQAEYELAEILGTVERRHWNDATQEWEYPEQPIYVPGQLAILEREYDRIRLHPAPSGMKGFLSPDANGTVVFYELDAQNQTVEVRYAINDPAGYDQWLAEPYLGGETHGQAMERVSAQMDQMISTRVPAAREVIWQTEQECRQDLIDQGYYAEQHFLEVNGHVEEVVEVPPVFAKAEEDYATGRKVQRYWRFKVESTADGPEPSQGEHNVYDSAGQYNPADQTALEKVHYLFEVDGQDTFDSQPHGEPLRHLIYNRQGQRLSVALMQAAPSSAPVANASGAWPTSDSGVTYFGGELKLGPEQLPGQNVQDTLPIGQNSWQGSYYWRVRAYNAVVGPVLARPRPRVVSVTSVAGTATVQLLVDARAHQYVQAATLVYQDVGYQKLVTGYQISTRPVAPAWVNLAPVDFVSDRRAGDGSSTWGLNPPWVPGGADRQQPWIGYDQDRAQYLLFASKKGYDGRWRIVGARAMALPTACEYDVYFTTHAAEAVFSPAVVKAMGQWWMFATVIDVAGTSPYLAMATSPDGHQWSSLAPLDGLADAAHAAVAYRNGQFHLWFERQVAGLVRIFYATSPDGQAFALANGGAAVLAGNSHLGSPSAAWWQDRWHLAYTEGARVYRVTSLDGVHWSSPQLDFSPATVEVQGQPELVTPRAPHLFVDLYAGNDELHVIMNLQRVNGQHLVYVARLEDCDWVAGIPGGLLPPVDTGVELPFARDGVTHALSLDCSANGVAPGDLLKVRLLFATQSPDEMEYRRHSRWVMPPFVPDDQSQMEPWPWPFNEQLRFVPYLEKNA